MPRRAARLATIVGLGTLFVIITSGAVRAADELDAHLQRLKGQVDDRSLRIEQRENYALEMASALDRDAQALATAEGKRKRWTQAINLLDEFAKENPGHPRSQQFQSQAAVYLWARGRLWGQQWELAPTDSDARESAIENLGVAIARLRILNTALNQTDDLLAQNVRFRLAQALADRAELEADGSESRRAFQREAASLLDRPINAATLQGFAQVLRAKLHAELGNRSESESALEAATKAEPAPQAGELLEAKAAVLIGAHRYDEALAAIDKSPVGGPLKELLAVRTLLAQRTKSEAQGTPASVEADLFRRIGPLRTSPALEARLSLIALARRLKEPGSEQAADAWEAVADGAALLGDLPRAAQLLAKGADRASGLSEPEKAAQLRLRAGAILFQAKQFLKADVILSRVADDPKAGALRPKAGLLRALARGRALALRLPEATQSSYIAALESQIRRFPNDSSTGEARWLFGKLRLAASDRTGALALWAAIPRNDSRWLEARLAIAALRQDDVESQRIGNQHEPLQERYNDARRFLSETLGQCRSPSERTAIELTRARLELTPDVGHPEEARHLCEQVLRSASQAEQRDEAQRLHVVALAAINFYLEAEQEARAATQKSEPAELLASVRLLDQLASESKTDLRMRRIGLIARVFLDQIRARDEGLSAADRIEARLRQTRALLFTGDDVRARNSLAAWSDAPPMGNDRLLRDLADTYIRLDAYDLAADVQRLRSQRASTDSPLWFESRYGLALAYYRAGKAKESRRVIDATAILHPDLGGGELHEKFVRLRQKLNPDE